MIWEPTLAAYDQFFFDRGFLAMSADDCNGRISTSLALDLAGGLATILSLLIGFPTAYYIATRPAQHAPLWVFLVTDALLGESV